VSSSWSADLPTVDDTRGAGEQLSHLLRPGDLLLLTGPLGAGKTAFAQGLGAGLGVRGAVTSPTFVIARVHPGGRVPLVHVDAYRLGDSPDLTGEIDALDLDVTLDDAVTAVEWGEAVVEQLAGDHLEVRIARGEDSDVRTVDLVPHGGDWADRLGRLADGTALWADDYADRLDRLSVVRGPEDGPYPCPCCGNVTLPERGGFDICPVCFWEDDGQDEQDADVVRGGPNGMLSLTAARANYTAIGAAEQRVLPFVRPPTPAEASRP
jgi:tRNA threonylcarbamoyladenosine biosynthesis protein TsaE